MFDLCMYRILKALIIAVWIGCTAWLIRYEAYPQWFEETVQGYKGLARELPEIRDSWMKVMDGDQHVGYAHSTTQMDRKEGKRVTLMSSKLFLQLQLFDGPAELRMQSVIQLDARDEFETSSLQITLKDSSKTSMVEGKLAIDRVSPDSKLVRIHGQIQMMNLPPFAIDRTFDLPREAIVSSPLLDFGFTKLRPGEELNIRTLDPFSFGGGTMKVTLRGEGRETWPEGPEGEPIDVFHVSLNVPKYEMNMNAWIDEVGRPLRQDTPFGVQLVYSSFNEAMKVPEDAALNPTTLLSGSPLPTVPTLPLTP